MRPMHRSCAPNPLVHRPISDLKSSICSTTSPPSHTCSTLPTVYTDTADRHAVARAHTITTSGLCKTSTGELSWRRNARPQIRGCPAYIPARSRASCKTTRLSLPPTIVSTSALFLPSCSSTSAGASTTPSTPGLLPTHAAPIV